MTAISGVEFLIWLLIAASTTAVLTATAVMHRYFSAFAASIICSGRARTR